MIEARILSVWGTDTTIAQSAWVSTYDVIDRPQADVERVVRDIVEHDHGTPQERVWLDFYLRLPIYCERQFDKYRMTRQIQGLDADVLVDIYEARMGRENITQNEMSGRYRTHG